MTKTKKKELKKRLFKILNIVSYILSVLMIMILIVCIVQGCSNTGKKRLSSNSEVISQPHNAYYDNTLTYYEPLLLDSTISLDGQSALSNGAINVRDNYDSNPGPYTYTWYNVNTDYGSIKYISADGETYLNVEALQCQYITYSSLGTYVYRLYGIRVNLSDDSDDYLIQRVSDNPFSNTYQVINGYLQCNNYLLDNEVLSKYFKQINIVDFVFNKDFNFNAPLGLNLSNYFGGSTSMATLIPGAGIYRITYDLPLFYSNGYVYDGIAIDYAGAHGNHFLINNNLVLGDEGALSYFALGFRRAGTSTFDFVNYRDTSQYQNLSTDIVHTYMLQTSTWVNDAWRYITFLSPLSDTQNVKINAFNNNNQYNGGIYNGGDNVFTLIASAFTGLMPLLSTMILPNITIGMLLLIPLVVMLVFAIIKIIKK